MFAWLADKLFPYIIRALVQNPVFREYLEARFVLRSDLAARVEMEVDSLLSRRDWSFELADAIRGEVSRHAEAKVQRFLDDTDFSDIMEDAATEVFDRKLRNLRVVAD